ncbi:uncharacterized protein LOC133316493 [Gastrolobium bilobum]|uniref:uncharacterized protein LOC133316493 n=1 Tax=Gastrolobium bilobum TaxID=150636 RepID=UPI002AB26CAB|nr:uncharacterized protein LOC133316493 [Gastrolobium bilobum]
MGFGFCKHCLQGKQNRVSFDSIRGRAEGILDLIHSDVFGPTPVASHRKSSKDEVFAKFREFKALVENQFDRKIKLRSLPQGSITNWDDLATKFLARFFSASKTERLKAEITAFEQKESESLYEAWERFKGLLRKCPQHGMEAWEKGRTFFQGMTSSTRTLVNAAARGSLKTKTPEEALKLLESLASQEFDNAPVPSKRAGIMKRDGYDALLAQNEQILQINKKQQAQLDALTKQIANSQVSSVNNPQITCGICAGTHATEDCDFMRAPENAEVNRLWYDQKNQNQHPGLSYKSNHQLNPPISVQPRTPQQSNTSEWEKVVALLCKTTSDYIQGANAFREDISAFMQETTAAHRNQEASIRNLEIQIVVNPREHCNVITTRSGTVIQPIEEQPEEKKRNVEASVEEQNKEKAHETIEVDKSIPEKVKKKLFKWEKKKALERQDKPLDLSPYARIPYPQRLKKEIQKQKMKKLGITEVKPTKTIVQLADCSSKQAYGIIKDILVKVDKFIIPVDFVILDIEEDATILMIFGRPFLATSGALIDVLKGELILRVDGEQAIFKFFDKEFPSFVAQLEDQVYYIGERKDLNLLLRTATFKSGNGERAIHLSTIE